MSSYAMCTKDQKKCIQPRKRENAAMIGVLPIIMYAVRESRDGNLALCATHHHLRNNFGNPTRGLSLPPLQRSPYTHTHTYTS